jgi:pyruvate dehydrogenase E2 component (dihydrolipoamide acetyltransferase)
VQRRGLNVANEGLKRQFHTSNAGGVRAASPLEMPALSPTMTEGNLATWLKKEGDHFKPGDVLAEVETDKATVAFEATEEGYLAKILVPAGTSKIQVGSPIAITVTEKSEIASAAAAGLPKSSGASGASAPAAAAAPAPAAAAPAAKKPSVPHTVLQMPALSPTMTEGTLVRWNVKAGQRVKPGDSIAEIETDKATVAFEATEEGYIAKLLVEAGAQKVEVNSPIAVMTDSEGNVSKLASFTLADAGAGAAPTSPAASAPATPSASSASTSSTSAAAAPSVSTGGRVFASPLARKVAQEKGVDLSQVTPTGPNNRIVAADVREFTPSAAAAAATTTAAGKKTTTTAAAAGGDYVDLPVSNIRRVTAERLTQSKQNIPHYYLSMDCNVDKLLQVREELNASGKGEYKLSVNDFIVKAASLALRKVPECNSEWRGDVIRRYQTVDINVAVTTSQGLFTPLVRNADQKGLSTISAQVKELAEKAKAGKIALDDIQPGTFTISNLGMFGISQFAAVINPPQACILAIGGTEKRLVPASNEAGFTTANVLTVTLSCDHRVVDGSVGATYLQFFKDYLENPLKLLL